MGKKTEVHAGQQHQGGGGNTFQKQVRRTGTNKKRGQKRAKNSPSVNKYINLIGVTKPKPVVQEHRFMSSCHCNGAGSCTFCVQEKRAQQDQRIRQTEPKRESHYDTQSSWW